MDIKLPKGYCFVRRLGQGGQAVVILAKESQPGENATSSNQLLNNNNATSSSPIHNQENHVAIKCYVRNALKEPLMLKRVKREIRHLKLLDHPHIIGLKKIEVNETHLFLIMDYASGGSLFDLLSRTESRILEEDLARWFFQQLITGIDYAHKKGVTNRDVKPENMLFYPVPEGKVPILVLCDFGLSRWEDSGFISRLEGTMGFVAPESFLGHCRTIDQGKKAEIYACGVSLFQMLFGLTNYPSGPVLKYKNNKIIHKEEIQQIRTLLTGGPKQLDFPKFRTISNDCKDFLTQLLQPNPKHRLEMNRIWEHAWFRKKLPQEAISLNSMLLEKQSHDANSYGEDIDALFENLLSTEPVKAKTITNKFIKPIRISFVSAFGPCIGVFPHLDKSSSSVVQKKKKVKKSRKSICLN